MRNSYDHIAERWNSNFRGQAYLDRVLGYVDVVLEGLEPQARVLDLGCGTGTPIARYIVEKGFRVVGVDQSEKMLEIARLAVPEAEFVHRDMIDVELADGFGAAIAWDSIFHVERKHHSDIFHKLAQSLEHGGRLLLSVGGSGAGDSEAGNSEAGGFTSEMFGYTFFYSGHEPGVARKLLEAEGFEIEVWEVDDPSSRGHIAVIARRVA
jgi:cyclopropane fatty-acyl-phospholipid synthase-like methyltransferase